MHPARHDRDVRGRYNTHWRAPGQAAVRMIVFLDSMLSYLSAWLGAFTLAGRRYAPLTWRRGVVLLLFPLFLAAQLMHWLFLALDELLFPAYRAESLRQPVFVLGVPRSGTTHLHRELARDRAFTAPRSWEVVAAPSVCQRRLVGLASRVDAAMGWPLTRALTRVVARLSSDLDDVHPVGLLAAEEDYLALLPAAGCFFALLAFPQHRPFRNLACLDRLSPARRRRLLDHYHRLLQRQAYSHAGAQLLSKNAAFASWAPYLSERYPDALFVVCVREPAAALASQLVSVADARSLFATFPHDADIEALFAEFYGDWWPALAGFARKAPDPPLVIEQEWLRGHTDEALSLIYARLDRDRPLPATVKEDTAGAGAKGSKGLPWPLDLERAQQPASSYSALAALAIAQRGATP